MNVLQAIEMLEKIHKEVGNLQVCFVVEYDGGFGFEFPCAIAPIGMPNEDETAETLVCAFMHPDVAGDGAEPEDYPSRVVQVVK